MGSHGSVSGDRPPTFRAGGVVQPGPGSWHMTPRDSPWGRNVTPSLCHSPTLTDGAESKRGSYHSLRLRLRLRLVFRDSLPCVDSVHSDLCDSVLDASTSLAVHARPARDAATAREYSTAGTDRRNPPLRRCATAFARSLVPVDRPARIAVSPCLQDVACSFD